MTLNMFHIKNIGKFISHVYFYQYRLILILI